MKEEFIKNKLFYIFFGVGTFTFILLTFALIIAALTNNTEAANIIGAAMVGVGVTVALGAAAVGIERSY